ncbi:hypothetical protein ABZ958_34345 [Streptomyces sp. NPDC046237]
MIWSSAWGWGSGRLPSTSPGRPEIASSIDTLGLPCDFPDWLRIAGLPGE